MTDYDRLQNEDSFDDNDCAEYELMDYLNAEEGDEEKEETDHKKKTARRRTIEEKEEDQYDFYKCRIIIEPGEVSRKRYARLSEIARTGTPTEQAQAKQEACLYMKGLVRDMINKFFHTYVEKDPSYAEDLEQEAYFNIMKYLPYYDPTKALPTTFFYRHIKSAMVGTTNQMKHSISSAYAALIRKIKRANKEYAKIGRTPTIADYMIETGETMSTIRDVLRMMNTDANTHLEAIEGYDQVIAGDPDTNSVFESPESQVMKKITHESVMRRMYELFTEKEIAIFLRFAINKESIPSIARNTENLDDDKIRRIIEKIKHAIQYDAEVRSLCSGYIRDDPADMAIVTILPIAGENENMDLLETIAL